VISIRAKASRPRPGATARRSPEPAGDRGGPAERSAEAEENEQAHGGSDGEAAQSPGRQLRQRRAAASLASSGVTSVSTA
jgi:hypothetical protein